MPLYKRLGADAAGWEHTLQGESISLRGIYITFRIFIIHEAGISVLMPSLWGWLPLNVRVHPNACFRRLDFWELQVIGTYSRLYGYRPSIDSATNTGVRILQLSEAVRIVTRWPSVLIPAVSATWSLYDYGITDWQWYPGKSLAQNESKQRKRTWKTRKNDANVRFDGIKYAQWHKWPRKFWVILCLNYGDQAEWRDHNDACTVVSNQSSYFT